MSGQRGEDVGNWTNHLRYVVVLWVIQPDIKILALDELLALDEWVHMLEHACGNSGAPMLEPIASHDRAVGTE